MDGSSNGLIRKYEFHVSEDGEEWTKVNSGNWLPYCTEVNFTKRSCRYIKLVATEGTYASLAELDVVIDKDNETGIENSTMVDEKNKRVVRRSFYTVNGILLASPPQGLYIEKTLFADGTISCTKKWME